MNKYSPDGWVLLKIKDYCKVFGSWAGVYTGSDSWRINSGIVKVEEDGDYILFYGASGSCYSCHKDTENSITSYNWSVVNSCLEIGAEVISYEQFKKEWHNGHTI